MIVYVFIASRKGNDYEKYVTLEYSGQGGDTDRRGLRESFQTTSKTETQPHVSADSLCKVILNSQTPQNTLSNAAPPIRGTRHSFIHQSVDTSPSHQEPTEAPESS